jgi:hypothetical protein
MPSDIPETKPEEHTMARPHMAALMPVTSGEAE